MKKIVLVLLAIVSLAVFAGCKSKKDTLTVSPSSLSVAVGESKAVTANYSGDKELIWQSADPAIATVTSNASGASVKGVAEGSVKVTVKAGDLSAELTVTVTKGATPEPSPDAQIKVYTRDTASGTRDGFFTGIGFKDAIKDNSLLAKGYIEVTGNGDMINKVNNDEFGIGYISLSSLQSSGLKGLKYEGVDPSEANVINGSYKLTRNFNYIIRNDAADSKENQIAKAFVAYMFSVEGLNIVKSKDGIVDIPADAKSWNDLKAEHPICLEDNSALEVRFGGSTSVQKIAEALSAAFSPLCGNFKAIHDHTGSGDAFKRTQGSEKDSSAKLHVAFASRDFKADTEVGAAGTFGKLCTDAIVVVVNSKNALSQVTAAQLKAIFSGQAGKWSELK